MGEERSESELCVQCGLCCSGAIFDFGPLETEHRESARDAGMVIIEKEGKLAFGLPCPCLDGAICTNYTDRPPTCRTFRCTLLKSLEAELISFEEAEQRIAEARDAFANLKAQLPSDKTIADARRWRREAGNADASATLNASPMIMMALGLLDVLLDQHFRGTNQRQVMPQD